MNKSKILGLVMLAGATTISVGTMSHAPKKVQNNVMLTQHLSSNNKNNAGNQTLSKKQAESLKNKTVVVNGMKFSGLQAIKIAPNMPQGEFAATPGFNPDGFASSVNESLYNYELNPANDQAAMNEATELHGGNPIDTCVFFQSSALRAIGQDVPDSIGFTTHLENWLANNGWTRHEDFQDIQRGDICFASYYHTFLFMGWENKAKGIAYVMGNESFVSPYYRNRNLNGQSPVTYGNNSYYQATCYWTYGQGYTGQIAGINPVHPGGYNSIGTATTTTTLNLRSNPNLQGSILTEVPNGVTVPVIAQNGVWYEVYYNGKTGWIDGDYTKGLDESLGNGSATTNMPNGDNLTVTSPIGLWLTNGPSGNSGNIVLLPDNTPVKALSFSNGWYKVNYEGTIGWLDAQYTSANGSDILHNQATTQNNTPTSITKHNVDGTVTVTCDGLWINSNPTANDGNLIVVPHGTKLHTTEESSNGWYKVTYKGQTGWIGGAPFSTFTPAPVQQPVVGTPVNKKIEVVAGGLCLNKNPKANDGTITVLPHGTIVTATEQSSNGWYKVTYKGQTGWIGGTPYSKVISSEQQVTGTPVNKTLQVVAGGLCLNKNPKPNDGTILVLPHNTVVKATEESSNGWYKVTYKGQTGWIGGAPYSKVISSGQQQSIGVTVNKTLQVVAGGLCLNKNPKPNDGTILVLPHGAIVKATEESSNGWYKVTYNGKTGWIGGAPYSKVIGTPINKNIQVVAGGLCLNTNPEPNDGTILVLPHGAIVKATEESPNGWYRVTYNGKTGWIGGAPYSKVVETPIKTIEVVAGGLCLNRNPEPNDGVITVLPHGTIVTSTEQSSNGWHKVTYKGKTGWIGGAPYSKVISSTN